MKQLTHGGDIYSKRDIPKNKKIIDFSANVNPLGMPPSVKNAIIDNIDAFSNYPDPFCRELTDEISRYESVPRETIICGNGAADIIYRITAATKPKLTLLPAPTFTEYQQAAEIVNSTIRYHYLREDKGFIIDEEILDKLSPDIDLMFLCNPNNPTGIPIEKELVLSIADRCKLNNTFLVVDECFVDFLGNSQKFSIVNELKDYSNVIVLKAFTKIYAMAGIRLGYGICYNKNVIEKIHSIGQPWSVSVIAQKCGVAALKENQYVSKTKNIIKENREYLIEQLRLLGLGVFNSEANYILFKSGNKHLQKTLEKQGILIRCCDDFIGLNDSFFRIAVKAREDNEYLINSLEKIMKNAKNKSC
ncbi:aminotransferase class I/II-fold pyridoxal phosphate-dependent enzyme [Ruminiclostridium herbifermentans]|uniref:Aminotransferase class I/II-fold pyridoxal phosphate-dependent enzyme n=1 Tax=Ruminiclostridium herbifermentans TaxID=2488810 RepID=A0A4V6EPU6_9FIRM|nr:histidinol-phosphate transaminase [Ruminiclostridium herbifermentans]QNU67085.1 aminotransferase class I/II-fold pyridoxal phosphate-dependent enzyme [Ruminiclostridium herbifermentans]